MILALLTLSLFILDQDPEPPIRLATWNLENFFDVFDDPWRSEEGTRPAFTSLERQERLGKIIRDLDADILCLQEIENRFFLEDFVKRHLARSGYEVVHFEGNDKRGIDVALLSRLPVGPVSSYRHLRFPGPGGKLTRLRRDLLRVRVEGRLQADVFVVHLKSQQGGDAADEVRVAEARAIAGILKQELDANPDYRALLAGDFNDIADSPTLLAFSQVGMHDPFSGSDRVTYNRVPYRSRIDFMLLTPGLAKELGASRIREDKAVLSASDHNPVAIEIGG